MDNEIKFLGGKAVMRPDKNAEYHKISESDWDGIWYPADRSKEKVMIVVSGSDGGLEHAGMHIFWRTMAYQLWPLPCSKQDIPGKLLAKFRLRESARSFPG